MTTNITRARVFSLLTLLSFLVLHFGCSSAPKKSIAPERPWQKIALKGYVLSSAEAFGSKFVIRVWPSATSGKTTAGASASAQAAVAEVKRIAGFADGSIETSLVSKINSSAYRSPVEITAELAGIITDCNRMLDTSDGKFDVTFVPYKEGEKFTEDDLNKITEWDKKDPNIGKATRLFGQQNMLLDSQPFRVRFYNRRTRLNLKGMIRGYAIERAAQILSRQSLAGFAVIADGFFAASGVALTDPGLMCIENPAALGTCLYKIKAAPSVKVLYVGTSVSNERHGDMFDPNSSWTSRSGGVIVAGERGAWVQFATTISGLMDDPTLNDLFQKTVQPKVVSAYFNKLDPRKLEGSLAPFASVTH